VPFIRLSPSVFRKTQILRTRDFVIIRDHSIMIGTKLESEHQQSVDSYVSMLCDLSHLEQLCRLYQVSDIKRINYERALAAYIITSAQRSITALRRFFA